MANRYADWLRQAEADLRHARNARESGDFEWSCFAAQQAAEKALKAYIQKSGGAPTDYYTRGEADAAIDDAEAIVGFCRDAMG